MMLTYSIRRIGGVEI